MTEPARPLNATDSAPDLWSDNDWQELLYAIRNKMCTPFVGAGACAGVLPLGRDLATRWADKYHYPFDDRTNLPRVAQFVAINVGPRLPKFLIKEEFEAVGPPDFNKPNEPHRVIADIRLPLYITTNYDNFLCEAIRIGSPPREVTQVVCPWHLERRKRWRRNSEAPLEPTVDKPLVYHLHGHLGDIDSMVLTEDDYLDFLVSVAENPDVLSNRLVEAFASSSLLFLGYSLEDLDFKVLLRQLSNYMQRAEGARHVAVQLAPGRDETTEERRHKARAQQLYLQEKYKLQRVRVYWGTCEQFAAELRGKLGGPHT